MKKIIETVIYTCDWCGEEFDAKKQPIHIELERKYFGTDVVNRLTISPVVYIHGEPHHDVCDNCFNNSILKYAEGLKNETI